MNLTAEQALAWSVHCEYTKEKVIIGIMSVNSSLSPNFSIPPPFFSPYFSLPSPFQSSTSASAMDDLEEILPSVPVTCLLLKKFDAHTFITKELLSILNHIDLSDEAGRRQLVLIFRDFLASPAISDECVPLLLKQLARVYLNEKDFVTLVLDTIADVREPLDMFTTPEAEELFRHQVGSYSDSSYCCSCNHPNYNG